MEFSQFFYFMLLISIIIKSIDTFPDTPLLVQNKASTLTNLDLKLLRFCLADESQNPILRRANCCLVHRCQNDIRPTTH